MAIDRLIGQMDSKVLVVSLIVKKEGTMEDESKIEGIEQPQDRKGRDG